MKRIDHTLAVLAVLLALAWPLSEGSAAQTPLRIAGTSCLGDLPMAIADAKGLFARNGLEAEINYCDSENRNLARLLAGETDFTLMPLTPLVLDRLSDPGPRALGDTVILASVMHSTALNQVVVLANSGIETPQQLRGRRVIFAEDTNAELVWSMFAVYHGIDPASVELRAVSAGVVAIPAHPEAGAGSRS